MDFNIDYIKLLQPITDIFKYFITNKINTGDRTFDASIITFILLLFSLFINEKNIKLYLNKNNIDKDKNKDNDKYNKYYIDNYKNMCKINYSSSEDTLNNFDNYIEDYIVHLPTIKKLDKNSFIHYYINNKNTCIEGNKMLNNVKLDSIETSDGNIIEIPIHIYTTISNKYVYISLNHLYAIDLDAILEFKNFIINKNKDKEKENKDNEIKKKEDNNKQFICEYIIKEKKLPTIINLCEIYSNRTFDYWFSIHKKKILKLIDRFENINKNNKSHLHGFGSYNLGIILSGEPGTGKTSFVKALANKLKKNVLIINSNSIKTLSDFSLYIKNYKKYILFFDEFDSIPGIRKRFEIKENNINNNDNNDNIQNNDNKLTDLKLELIKSINDKNLEIISKELNKIEAKIEAKIENLENIKKVKDDELNIYNILTILDGMEEHRGRVIIAATNHIDQIDPALLREGRFDFKFKLTKYIECEVKELCSTMFPEFKDIIENTSFEDGKYTAAELINLALQNDFNNFIDIIKKK